MLEAPPTLLLTLFRVVLVLVLVALAGVSFLRLRLTASGLLIGGSIVLRLLGMLVLRIVSGIAMAGGGVYEWMGWQALIAALGNGLCSLLLIVGLLLLPRSLRRLAG